MIVIPAIDLKDHQVVRLSQGKMGKAKVYSDNPIEIAKLELAEDVIPITVRRPLPHETKIG